MDAVLNDPTPSVSGNPVETAVTQTPPPTAAGAQAQVGGSAVTAPADPYREAADRLSKGESADTIQRDLHARAGASTKTAAAAAPTGQQPVSQPAGVANAQEESGLTEKELSALKRAQFPLDTLKQMPLANRKAIAKGFSASQAEADRQFQQQRQGGQAAPAATPAPAQASAAPAAGQTQTNTPPQPSVPQGTQAAQEQAAPDITNVADLFKPFKMSDEDFGQLRDAAGEEFATTFQQQQQKMFSHVTQALQPLVNITLGMAQHIEDQQFNAALADIKKLPGHDKLTDDQVKALREKSELLIKAGGNVRDYGFGQATLDAAASLFKIDTQKAAQAALLKGRTATLNGSPDRGTGQQSQPRQMTEAQRMRAIGDFMVANPAATPQQARNAIDAL